MRQSTHSATNVNPYHQSSALKWPPIGLNTQTSQPHLCQYAPCKQGLKMIDDL